MPWTPVREGTGDAPCATRRAITADSLAALVTQARAAMGADGAATRSVAHVERIEPASADAVRGLGIRARPDAAADEALRALATLLLPPTLVAPDSGVTSLVIVAPGALASVPFAALPMPGDTMPVSARYSIAYTPSLLLRAASNSEAVPLPRSGYHGVLDGRWTEPDSMRVLRREWLSRAVVLGNPVMPAVTTPEGVRIPLAPLPGAESEAEHVARRLGVTPLLGARATFASLRSRADSATIVHLATHGYAYGSEAKVGESFVALAPAAGDDGLLTVKELLEGGSLTLGAADLVVLSACQTGLGQLTASEGTLGLQRAFLAAGAASVLVSLWSVSDEATAELLQSFYSHWLDDGAGWSKAEALRLAQESLRAKPAYAHPRYWAAFQLVGR